MLLNSFFFFPVSPALHLFLLRKDSVLIVSPYGLSGITPPPAPGVANQRLHSWATVIDLGMGLRSKKTGVIPVIIPEANGKDALSSLGGQTLRQWIKIQVFSFVTNKGEFAPKMKTTEGNAESRDGEKDRLPVTVVNSVEVDIL